MGWVSGRRLRVDGLIPGPIGSVDVFGLGGESVDVADFSSDEVTSIP